VAGIAIGYGLWFDYLDSLPGIGALYGGNLYYQPWNIIGHFVPSLFMLIMDPKKIELFFAAFLISTAVMDLPNWGMERLYLHHGYLWLQHGNTYSLSAWIGFYYSPFGSYGVWGGAFPTAAVMFWSVVARLGAAFGLIWYQDRLERHVGRDVRLLSLARGLK
jgi:hypothetical protein